MTDEERIRQLAYSIWEAEGRPEGQQQHHWERARKIVAAEQSADNDEELEALGEPLDEPPIFEDDLPLEEDEMGIQENRLPLDDPNDDALLDDDALPTDTSLQDNTLVEQNVAEVVPSKKTAAAPTKRKPASTPKSEAKVAKKAAPRAKRAKTTKPTDRS